MKYSLRKFEELWRLKEIKARQHSRERERDIEGHKNTAYFQAVANRRKRKKTINSLEGPNGVVEDTKNMLHLAVDFYKTLFDFEQRMGISLRQDFWEERENLHGGE